MPGRAHNTIYSADGSRVFMAGLKSPLLSVADTKTHKVASTVGPFGNSIRPFTVNGAGTLVFVSHDRQFVASLATQIIELGGGGFTHYPGNYDDYLLSRGIV